MGVRETLYTHTAYTGSIVSTTRRLLILLLFDQTIGVGGGGGEGSL